MITLKRFSIVSVALALVGFVGSSLVASRFATPATARSSAAWAFVANDPRTLAGFADAIVVARTVASYPGRIATSDTGEDALPFQIVEFEVREALKGAFPTGSVFVERAGGIEPLSGIEHEIDIDGGEFAIDRTYLLFLNEQPGETGLYYQVNDQGRYELSGSKLRALDPEHDPVQQVFHRRTIPEAISIVRRLQN